MDNENQKYMYLALEQAKLAGIDGEVPIGAIIIKDGQIISSARNQVESLKNPCAHAELKAIEAACDYLGKWRLDDCSLYVTLEPCPMCMGAIRLSRLPRLFISACESRMGAVSKFPALTTDSELGPVPQIVSGILKDESEKLLKDFFKKIRQNSVIREN